MKEDSWGLVFGTNFERVVGSNLQLGHQHGVENTNPGPGDSVRLHRVD